MLQDHEPITIGPGEHVIQPPGWVHTIHNTGTEDLCYYVVSDNPNVEVIYYPDSDRWLVNPPRKVFQMREVDHFDEEVD